MVEIKVITEHGIRTISAEENQSILSALQNQNVLIQAPCNGRGTCGKCRIRVGQETSDRLACQTYPEDNMIIEVQQEANRIEVLSKFCGETCNQETVIKSKEKIHEASYKIAVDLGTTTVVMQLLRIGEQGGNPEILQTVRSLNPQSSYGADVISRITAANNGAGRKLQQCICKLLCDGIEQMCYTNHLCVEQLQQIAIAGNTTMIHLLRGYDVSELGRYPFQPVNLALEQISYLELSSGARTESMVLMENSAADHSSHGPKVIIMPGISAFVGGDITAGLYALKIHRQEEISLFIDLGTNGELAIGNKERILVTSTAAGPAFEGGNLSCGIGSVPGAITEVTMKKRYTAVKTIDNRPAIGICGTGAIEMLAELWNKGYIDEHGSFFSEEYRKQGVSILSQQREMTDNLKFTQEDIRQMQLAKGAIRAGVEVLMKAYGVSYDQIAHLYLAGGMGFSLNLDKAADIGLIPPQLKEKVRIVGNSSLGGVIQFLQQSEIKKSQMVKKEVEEIANSAESIQLAESEVFAGDYLSYLDFQKKG